MSYSRRYESYSLRLDELLIKDMKFLHGQDTPTLAVRHVLPSVYFCNILRRYKRDLDAIVGVHPTVAEAMLNASLVVTKSSGKDPKSKGC